MSITFGRSNLALSSSTEVIFESFVFKASGSQRVSSGSSRRPSLGSLTGFWRKKYLVLVRNGNAPRILFYNKKPNQSGLDEPASYVELGQRYRVSVMGMHRGKEFVCQLAVYPSSPQSPADNSSQRSERISLSAGPAKTILLAADKPHIYQLLIFFLRTQTVLRDNAIGERYVVRPDNSEEHRRIGSRGSMCILHVSSWGLTLALELSTCVLAQWPLRCIRWYECTGRGRLSLEVGSQAETGAGRFVFVTRQNRDSEIYESIDAVVNNQASLQNILSSSSPLPAAGSSESMADDYYRLHDVTMVALDSSFMPHIRKISRDIYDHLAEHLGGASTVVYTRSSSNLLEDSPSSVRVHSQPITMPGSSRTSAQSPMSVQSHLSNHTALSFETAFESQAQPITSQYLHMVTLPTGQSHVNRSHGYENNNIPHFYTGDRDYEVENRESVGARGSRGNYSLCRGDGVTEEKQDGDYSMEKNTDGVDLRSLRRVKRRDGDSNRRHDAQLRMSRSLNNLTSAYMDMSSHHNLAETPRHVPSLNSQQYPPTLPGYNECSQIAMRSPDAYPYSYATCPDFSVGRLTNRVVQGYVSGQSSGPPPGGGGSPRPPGPRPNHVVRTSSESNLLEQDEQPTSRTGNKNEVYSYCRHPDFRLVNSQVGLMSSVNQSKSAVEKNTNSIRSCNGASSKSQWNPVDPVQADVRVSEGRANSKHDSNPVSNEEDLVLSSCTEGVDSQGLNSPLKGVKLTTKSKVFRKQLSSTTAGNLGNQRPQGEEESTDQSAVSRSPAPPTSLNLGRTGKLKSPISAPMMLVRGKKSSARVKESTVV